MTDTATQDDAILRQGGRALLISIHTAQRALKLYPLENAAVQRALDELLGTAVSLCRLEGVVEVRIASDVIFINQTRLRLGLDNFAAFSGFVSLMKSCGVGLLRLEDGLTRRECQAFLSAIASLPPDLEPEDRLEQLRQRMQRADIIRISVEVGGEGAGTADGTDRDEGLERAKRTYARGVAIARDVVQGVRMGRTPSTRRLKRAIQVIVDQVMENELSITGLTTMREYDEYTFTHSVNVCIFAVALGKRLGFDRIQLYDLGLAALLHDIGKARLEHHLLDKMPRSTSTMARDAVPSVARHVDAVQDAEGEDLPYRGFLPRTSTT